MARFQGQGSILLPGTMRFAPSGQPGVPEHRPDKAQTHLELMDWYSQYIADRRARGIPPKGLPLPRGIRNLDDARLHAGAMAP